MSAALDRALAALASHRPAWAVLPEAQRPWAGEVFSLLDAVCRAQGRALTDAIDDYAAAMAELTRQQRFLERHGRYACADEASARRDVYADEAAMATRYCAALLASQALWPTHLGMLAFFRARFVDALPARPTVLEVPTGTGLFLSEVGRARPSASLVGVDASAGALSFAATLLAARGVDARLEQADAWTYDPAPVDALVCGELLEHVDDPAALLARLVRWVAPGGTMFLSTAIWAGSPDHVTLFQSVAEVRALLGAHVDIDADAAWPFEPDVHPDEARRPMTYACVARPRG